MEDYIFHYNGDLADAVDDVEPGEMTYHEHLTEQDGRHCVADPANTEASSDGRLIVEAYFDDGNELDVYLDELTPLKPDD